MAQTQLPIFYKETHWISDNVAFEQRDDFVYYFNGLAPIFQHHKDDIRSFRLITSQMYVNGLATQSEISRAFNVSKISVKRWVKKLREEGAEAFFLNVRHKIKY